MRDSLKILVFEYVSGGGMAAETPSPALLREAEAMLNALLRDLSSLPEVAIVGMRDARLPTPDESFVRTEWRVTHTDTTAQDQFAELVAECDAVWPIAPETDGILENLCRAVEASGKALLTSPASAVRIAASKLATAQQLEIHGVPHAPTLPISAVTDPAFPMVVKPDDGVGCEGARIIEHAKDWRVYTNRAETSSAVAQPLIEGNALSLSALFAHGKARLLSVNRQYVVRKSGGFVLEGCGVNQVENDHTAFAQLADRIAAALPELWGYAGIDLILSERGPLVLEINPRLTTSYVGLHTSIGLNPAGLVLNLWRLGELPNLDAIRREPVDIFEPHHEY